MLALLHYLKVRLQMISLKHSSNKKMDSLRFSLHNLVLHQWAQGVLGRHRKNNLS